MAHPSHISQVLILYILYFSISKSFQSSNGYPYILIYYDSDNLYTLNINECIDNQGSRTFRTDPFPYQKFNHRAATKIWRIYGCGTNKYQEHVITVDIYQNQIDIIVGGLFAAFPNVNKLELRNSNIREIIADGPEDRRLVNLLQWTERSGWIQPDTFGNSTRLTSLKLKDNRIKHLHPDSFARVTHLRNLDLSNNKIKVLPAGVFAPLTKLLELSLRHNRLVTLNADAFGPSTQLEFLVVGANKLNFIGRDVFAHVRVTDTLEVIGNPIKCGCLDEIYKWASVDKHVRCRNPLIPDCIVPDGESVHQCDEQIDSVATQKYLRRVEDFLKTNESLCLSTLAIDE